MRTVSCPPSAPIRTVKDGKTKSPTRTCRSADGIRGPSTAEEDSIMTTITVRPAPRAVVLGAPGQQLPDPFASTLIGLVLIIIGALAVSGHLAAMPGQSAANIGVAAVVISEAGHPGAVAVDPQHTAGTTTRADARLAHELHDCWRNARRTGQDPSSCSTTRP